MGKRSVIAMGENQHFPILQQVLNIRQNVMETTVAKMVQLLIVARLAVNHLGPAFNLFEGA